jgi:hypothetical protein
MTKIARRELAGNTPQTFTDANALMRAVDAWAAGHVHALMKAATGDALSDEKLKSMALEMRNELAPYDHEKTARSTAIELLRVLDGVAKANQESENWQSGNWTSLLRHIGPVAADLARELRDVHQNDQPKLGELRLFVMQVADPRSSDSFRWTSACGVLRAVLGDKRDLDALVVLADFFGKNEADGAIQTANRRRENRSTTTSTGPAGATVADALEQLKIRDTIAEILKVRQHPRTDG